MKAIVILFVLMEGIALGSGTLISSDSAKPSSMESSSLMERELSAHKRLGYWRFDRPLFASQNGATPLLATNIGLVPGLDGWGAGISGPTPSILQYRTVADDGIPNIDLRQGTIRMYIKPNWSSQLRGGKGTGGFARLFEVGSWSSEMKAFWGVNFTPEGNSLTFGGQSEGKGATFLTVPFHHLEGLVSNQWCHLEISYSPHGSRIIVKRFDAPPADITGAPATIFPTPDACKTFGMRIGSDISGQNRIEAVVDEMEVFNYVLSEVEREHRLRGNVLFVESEGPGLNLRWSPPFPGAECIVGRRLQGESTETILTNTTGLRFSDTRGFENGRRYEYNIGGQKLSAGLRLPPEEYRGKVLLIVDRTQMKSATSKRIQQLQQDLVGDGWTPILQLVPRHNDKTWRANPPAIGSIKSMIVSHYVQSAGELKAVFLIGHVPVPYSGLLAPDAHPEHRGAWPADSFYGDMDGLWTDSRVNHVHPQAGVYSNVPGDGKFDQEGIPENQRGEAALEIAVGRIDFSRMPAFKGMTENDLINRYLEKDHRYRMGELQVPERVVAGSFFGNQHDDVIYRSALINESRLFKHDIGNVVQGNILLDKLGCALGIMGGYGSGGAIMSGAITTVSLAKPENEPPVLFYILKGSFFGDIYFSDDNLLRGVTGCAHYGLASLWTMELAYRLNGLALGASIGESLREAINETKNTTENYTCLIGDPTLRLHVLPPPANLTASKAARQTILTWTASSNNDTRYYVYRSPVMNAAFTERLTPASVSTNRFADENPPTAASFYTVRALQLKTTGSGSYTNIGQSAFVEPH